MEKNSTGFYVLQSQAYTLPAVWPINYTIEPVFEILTSLISADEEGERLVNWGCRLLTVACWTAK